jgi:hypothetical protein
MPYSTKWLWSENLYILKCCPLTLPYQLERFCAKTDLTRLVYNSHRSTVCCSYCNFLRWFPSEYTWNEFSHTEDEGSTFFFPKFLDKPTISHALRTKTYHLSSDRHKNLQIYSLLAVCVLHPVLPFAVFVLCIRCFKFVCKLHTSVGFFIKFSFWCWCVHMSCNCIWNQFYSVLMAILWHIYTLFLTILVYVFCVCDEIERQPVFLYYVNVVWNLVV